MVRRTKEQDLWHKRGFAGGIAVAMKDAKGHGSDKRGGGVAAHATGTNQVGTKTGWTPDEAERFLHSEGHVTNIGQISPEAQRHLDKLVKSGHAIKGEDPVWAGHHAVWQLVKPLPGYSNRSWASAQTAKAPPSATLTHNT